jgi:hypothetical protein
MVKVTGEVKQLQEIQVFNENLQNEFKKQVLILETFENGTPLRVEFTNSNIQKLSNIVQGDNVLIEFYLQGNYDPKDITKVYNSLIGKYIVKF